MFDDGIRSMGELCSIVLNVDGKVGELNRGGGCEDCCCCCTGGGWGSPRMNWKSMDVEIKGLEPKPAKSGDGAVMGWPDCCLAGSSSVNVCPPLGPTSGCCVGVV